MKIRNIPFVIVFLSSMFPLLGAFFNFNVYHLPAGLVSVAIGLILISQQKLVIKKDILTTLAAPALLTLLATQVIMGHGFVILAVGGYVLIFTLVFFVLFSTGAGSSLISIISGISSLYKFFLIGMLIETAIILLGWQPQLGSIFSAANGPSYKNYNSADVLRYFGFFKDAGGLNSVLLGSQIAGMLSLFATIWFAGIWKLKLRGSAIAHSGFWFKLSILVFLITVNGLNFLLLVLAGGIYTFYFSKKNRVILACLFGILIAVIYIAIANGFIFSRIFNQDLVHLQQTDIAIGQKEGNLDELQNLTTMGYYVAQFASPVISWLAQDWVSKLLGVGAPFFLNDDNNIAGDFGFGIGMLSSGVLWVSVFLLAVFVSCIPALKEAEIGSNERQLWSVFGAINALITLLWLASTIHYNQAFANPGGMTIFALHFAATVYCRYRYSFYKSGITHSDSQFSEAHRTRAFTT